MKLRFRLYIGIIMILSAGCNNTDEIIAPEDSFLKVYDDNTFNASYSAVDIIQTKEGNYLILSGKRQNESNFLGIQLILADKEGNFIQKAELPTALVHPLKNILETTKGFAFICMNSVNLQAQIVELLDDGSISEIVPLPNTYYPLAVSKLSGNSFLLLSYDNYNKTSVISEINLDGSVQKRQNLYIGAGEGVEKPIIDHFNRSGRELPFEVGFTSGNNYYFNGFYNYTFSLVFTALEGNEPVGLVQGQQSRGGLSNILFLEGSRFAAARFNYGDNAFLPGVEINTRSVSSVLAYPAYPMPELQPDARVLLKKAKIADKNYIFYAGDTRKGQIALFVYDIATGSLRGSKYLGFSFPYEAGNFIQTSDGGLAIVAITYVAGRFPRICLFKLSASELREILEK